MSRLPVAREFNAESSGWGFFLCARKEVRVGRGGEFLVLMLEDLSGQVEGRLFDEVERYKQEFDAGDFVKVQGRGSLFNGRLQFVIENIRRVNPDQDRAQGFSEDRCVRSAPRSIDDMWRELQTLVDSVGEPHMRTLLQHVVSRYEGQLRIWPAARAVHHAYRGGLLEHILKVAHVGRLLAKEYDADADLVVCGAVIHDIGKLQELSYDPLTEYSREGNLVGHIVLGVALLRDAARAQPSFPDLLRTHLEHLIVSHHGSHEFGSPVEPKTTEAFILSVADELDSKLNQVRQAVADDPGDAEFTAYHRRLDRVLWKGASGR